MVRGARGAIAVAGMLFALGYPVAPASSEPASSVLPPLPPPPALRRASLVDMSPARRLAPRADSRLADIPAWLFMTPGAAPAPDDGPGAAAASTDETTDRDAATDAVDVLADVPTPSSLPPDFALRTSVSRTARDDSQALFGATQRWHLVDFGAVATSPRLGMKVIASGQGAYASTDVDQVDRGFETAQEPTSLRLLAEVAERELGVEYRSFGKRLEPVVSVPNARKDRAGTEVWVVRQLGRFRLRLSQSDLSDNVDGNALLPRTRTSQTGMTAEVALPSWPVLGLTYATGESERSRLPAAPHRAAPERRDFKSVTGFTSYSRTRWNLNVSFTYADGRDATGAGNGMTTLSRDVSLSIRPADSITLVSTVSAGEDAYQPAGSRWDTRAASVALTYTPPGWWHAWTTLSYTAIRASDGIVDGRGVTVGGGVGWSLRRRLSWPVTISLEAGYDEYVDAGSAASASRGVHGFIVLRIPTP